MAANKLASLAPSHLKIRMNGSSRLWRAILSSCCSPLWETFWFSAPSIGTCNYEPLYTFSSRTWQSDVLGAVFLAHIQLFNALDLPFPLSGPLGRILCPLSPFISDSSFIVSILSNVVIAAERLQAVVFPRQRALPSTQYRRSTIFTIWLIAFSFFSLHFVTKKLIFEDGEVFCNTVWEGPFFDRVVSPEIYFVVSIVIFWTIPAILLVVMYGTVLIFLKRQGEIFRSMASPERQRDRQARNQNISTMLITVVVAFYVTWSPLIIFGVIGIFSPDLLRKDICHLTTLDFVFALMATTNSAINPFIYFILNKTYRRGMLQLILCPCHKICCSMLRAKLEIRERTSTDANVQSACSRVSSRTKSEIVVISMTTI